MTREQQKIVNAWKKSDAPFIRQYAKLYKLKSRSNHIWQIRNDIFYTLSLFSGSDAEGQVHLHVTMTYKPLWLDDLFWEIMDMASNSNEPKSLRAVGAFALYGVVYKDACLHPERPCPEEMERLIKQETEAFSKVTASVEEYFHKAEEAVYHGGVMRVINAIYCHNYDQSKELLSAEKVDYFVNGSEDFGTRARRYIDTLTQKGSV